MAEKRSAWPPNGIRSEDKHILLLLIFPSLLSSIIIIDIPFIILFYR
jgi:hypothetical protein